MAHQDSQTATWNFTRNLKEVIIIINAISQGDRNGMRLTRATASDRWGLRKLRCANATASMDSEGVCPDRSYMEIPDTESFLMPLNGDVWHPKPKSTRN